MVMAPPEDPNGDETSKLARQFEEHRGHLRSVAYRMLGALTDADDAIQETWLRLSRSDASRIENLRAWLTTVVARVSLDLLRARRKRIDEPVGVHLPDPIVSAPISDSMADAISLALLVVLDTLTPAERLTFVLHDMFDVPFDEIAAIVGKTPAAARQLASRARRRVQGTARPVDSDLGAQREVVEAFLAAARAGDFDALLRVLDPDVRVLSDRGTESRVLHGATSLAREAITQSRLAASVRFVNVNGSPGIVSFDDQGKPRSVLAFTIREGRIAEIFGLADPERLLRLALG